MLQGHSKSFSIFWFVPAEECWFAALSCGFGCCGRWGEWHWTWWTVISGGRTQEDTEEPLLTFVCLPPGHCRNRPRALPLIPGLTPTWDHRPRVRSGKSTGLPHLPRGEGACFSPVGPSLPVTSPRSCLCCCGLGALILPLSNPVLGFLLRACATEITSCRCWLACLLSCFSCIRSAPHRTCPRCG